MVAAASKPACDVSARLKHLPEYSLAQSSSSGRKKGFYEERYDPTIPDLAFQSEETSSVGKALGLEVAVVGKYKGPVLVVTGDYDYLFYGSTTPGNYLPAKDSPLQKLQLSFQMQNRSTISLSIPQVTSSTGTLVLSQHSNRFMIISVARSLDHWKWTVDIAEVLATAPMGAIV